MLAAVGLARCRSLPSVARAQPFGGDTHSTSGLLVDKMLGDVRSRLAARGLTLELTGTARAWLVKNGYDEAFGARPLRRLIQKEVENELARRVLANEFAEGDAVRVDVVDDRLAFERLTRATASPEPAIVPEVSQTA